jgi:hypothetical protein
VSDASLIVSICSATFTGGGLLAQYLFYRFNGARLKVQLVFCFRSDYSMTVSCTGARRKISLEQIRKNHYIDLGIEYANVRVTNIGRTPVSVENISFDYGRIKWFRRWRQTVVPMQFIDPNDASAERYDASPQRLDPGDNITVSFHLWPALGDPDLFKHRRFRRLVVRGSAQAVGRRATRSRRRDAWRMRKGELSVFRDITLPSPDLRVYRALWHHSYGREVSPVWSHRPIMDLLRKGKGEEEIEALLNEQNIDPRTGQPKPFQTHLMVAHEAYHAFHKSSALWAWPEVSPPNKVSWRERAHRALWGQQTR